MQLTKLRKICSCQFYKHIQYIYRQYNMYDQVKKMNISCGHQQTQNITFLHRYKNYKTLPPSHAFPIWRIYSTPSCTTVMHSLQLKFTWKHEWLSNLLMRIQLWNTVAVTTLSHGHSSSPVRLPHEISVHKHAIAAFGAVTILSATLVSPGVVGDALFLFPVFESFEAHQQEVESRRDDADNKRHEERNVVVLRLVEQCP